MLAALCAVPSVASDSRRQRLLADVGTSPDGDPVDELAGALDALDPAVRIVLDDVHELTGRDVLYDLARLIRYRPEGLQLVLASRVDPPISVPRLRLEGRLHELRADVLSFTPDDAAALLKAAGLDLTPAQVAVLHARTEGWAAGLRLAALALRATPTPTASSPTSRGTSGRSPVT